MSHPVLDGLASADAEERRAACLTATEDPAAVLLLDALARALGDRERRVAQAASDSLAKLATTCPEVNAVVRSALRGETAGQRWFAAFTYSRIEPVGPRLLPALIEALGSEAGDVRWAAARLLVNTGRVYGEVLPLALGLARTDPNPAVRCMALYCLRELAPDEPKCAQAVVEATRDSDCDVRRAALTSLASFTCAPTAMFDRLVEVTRDASDPASQRIATFALGALGARSQIALPETAVASLELQAADSPRNDLRTAARRALEGRSVEP